MSSDETDLDDEFARLGQQLATWDQSELERAARRFRQRRQAPPPRRVAGQWVLASALAIVASVAVWGLASDKSGSVGAPVAATTPKPEQPPAREVLTLADGSQVRLWGPDSRAEVAEQTDQRVRIHLTSGRAQFDIKHRPERTLEVIAGAVRIVDVGTVFSVERDSTQVRVAVQEGAVRVFTEGEDELLKAGQNGSYVSGDSQQPKPVVDAPVSPERHDGPTPKAPRHTSNWKTTAKQGDYKTAWQQMSELGMDQVSNNPTELLLAADVARLSGHPAAAVAPLERVIKTHSADPRAPAAAFTLGSLLLRALGRPRQAADAFGTAERLAPSGNLAADARARTVEAWLRSGDRARAERAFERYQRLHPEGRHLGALRGMLDSKQ